MTKYLNFYHACVSQGELTHAGICAAFERDELAKEEINLFEPSFEERYAFGHGVGWWGRVVGQEGIREFTPFRQNVVLFIACMNNEY